MMTSRLPDIARARLDEAEVGLDPLRRIPRSAQIPEAAPLATGRDTIPDEPVARGGLRQQVMTRILKSVFEGRFHPGQRLVVQRLAEQYQVSPTPVREALVELAGLGVVGLLPNRGAVVLPFGPQQAQEISQVRRVLEVEATRCAVGRIDADELASLEAELTRIETLRPDHLRDQDARAADTRLHGLVAECCGSARLAAEVGRYLLLFRALRDVKHLRDAGTNYSRSDDVQEHLVIVRALRAGDAERAARAMDYHVRATAERLLAVLFPERTDLGAVGDSRFPGPRQPDSASSRTACLAAADPPKSPTASSAAATTTVEAAGCESQN